jgi:hypothetical protein
MKEAIENPSAIRAIIVVKESILFSLIKIMGFIVFYKNKLFFFIVIK